METDEISLKDAVKFVVDNRGKTCPVQDVGMPLISTACIDNERLYPDLTTDRFVSDETFRSWFRSHPEPMDVILTNKGSKNGQVCLVPDPVDFCIAQDMVALRADEKKITPSYFFAALRSPLIQQRIKALNVDAVIPHFKKTDFDKLFIPCPTPEIQKFVGEQYLSFCSKIDLNQKMNQTLEDIAKAIFKSWFVDFDPVRAKAEGRPTGLPPEISDLFPDQLVDSEIGEIPKGWESTRISKIAKKVSEKYKKGENWSEEKLIDLSRMPSKSIALNAHGKGAELSTSVCKFKKYDFLFGSIRPYFYKAGICPFDGVSNTSVFILRSIEDFDREFIYLYSSSDQVFEQSIQYSDGTKMPIIKWQDFQDFSFALPDKTLRKHFSEIVRPMVERLICNVEEEKVLSELRDTLLPKLISGELRIPDAEKFLEEAGI